MSAKQFYHDIDLVKVGQLVDARIKNVDNSTESTLADTLGVDNKGLVIFNTDINALKVWSGSVFSTMSPDIEGDVVFQGVINPTNVDTGAVSAVKGYQYVVDAAGELSKTGVTFSPDATVEVGDMVLFTSSTTATIFQRNIDDATTSVKGQVELATTAETDAGTDTERAVTPASLTNVLTNISTLDTFVEPTQALNTTATTLADAVNELEGEINTLQGRDDIRAYVATVNLTAGVPLTVNHGLNLQDKDYFTIRVCDSGGSSISVDTDSVDVNNITLTSIVSLTGVKVFILGF
jgi:hypothetical protein